jgi:hypothetical protein
MKVSFLVTPQTLMAIVSSTKPLVDESNGFQVEQVDELCVGKDIPAEKAIKKMAI